MTTVALRMMRTPDHGEAELFDAPAPDRRTLDEASSLSIGGVSSFCYPPRMAKRGDDFGVLLAGGILLGMGLLAASSSKQSAEARRQQFEERIRSGLASLGLLLESVSPGRGRENEPFWDVLVQIPGGALWKGRARLAVGADPYAPGVPDLVLGYVARTLEADGVWQS